MTEKKSPPKRPPPPHPIVGYKNTTGEMSLTVSMLGLSNKDTNSTAVASAQKDKEDHVPASTDTTQSVDVDTEFKSERDNAIFRSDPEIAVCETTEENCSSSKENSDATADVSEIQAFDVQPKQNATSSPLRRIPSSQSAHLLQQEAPNLESAPTIVRSRSAENLVSQEIDLNGVPAESLNSRETADSGRQILYSLLANKYFIGSVSAFGLSLLVLPSFLSGLMLGSIVGGSLTALLFYRALPSHPIPEPKANCPSVEDNSTSVAGHTRTVSSGSRSIHQGWLNEARSYTLYTHSVGRTHSVYARLDGSQLRLQRPRHDLPRRELHDEPFHAPSFVQQRHFSLDGAKLSLLPEGLVRKRLWSKKYPIHILLSNSAPSFCKDKELFLFARTSRDKEDWYRRLCAATSEIFPGRLTDVYRHPVENESCAVRKLREHLSFMAKTVCLRGVVGQAAPNRSSSSAALQSLNALLSRAAWDMLRSDHWEHVLHRKLQAKLSSVHMPAYIDRLEVEQVSLGSFVPVITRVEEPYIDEKGLWLALHVTYDGGASLTIRTKVALERIREDLAADSTIQPEVRRSGRGALHENEEDSADSDSAAGEDDVDGTGAEEIDLPEQSPALTTVRHAGGRVLKLLGSVARSGLQKASHLSVVQKALESVAARPLVLAVTLQRLNGVLCVNLPLPPSDRLWYGFRPSPHISLNARPSFGEQTVNYSKVSDFIANRLLKEFERALVLPNMDDIVIPMFESHE